MTLSDIYKPKNFPDRTNERRRERTTFFSVFRVLRIFSYIFFIHFLTLALARCCETGAVDRPPSTLEMACVWSNIYNAIYVINSILRFWIVTLHCRTLSPTHFSGHVFRFFLPGNFSTTFFQWLWKQPGVWATNYFTLRKKINKLSVHFPFLSPTNFSRVRERVGKKRPT